MNQVNACPTVEAAELDQVLLQLGRRLQADGYRFVTVTPLTHQRNNERPDNAIARDLRDVFGWSRPFESNLLPEVETAALLENAIVSEQSGLLRSEVRWSSLDGQLFVHSAYPTVAHDSVFFGPDTYRFARAIEKHLHESRQPIRSAVDIGCGSGAGAILIALARREAQVQAVDINPAALRFTAVNAALAGVANVAAWHSDVLQGTRGDFDLIVANPPYMQDPQARAYRDGGGELGSALSVRIASEALGRLAPGGSLLLYTGAPSVAGVDLFLSQVQPLVDVPGFQWTYEEVDPDVFGEELETPGYRQAERIAAVVLTVTRT
ncbi:class I SAM-dependent methyltransferase [Pseudomonas sp. CFBP 8758]|uniref:methyltransferase n=1 Tax=Pseudomonas sp. CFBP 8758 TaxID=2775286 RepID=UPI001786F4B7|nr:class I SAM-dependent methyltransferase [Pseudomonas sp. CFBP 8758]MBD8593541.1 class I SAM-dependent methyltransferase [Pseudomonas sp. CFBP 8758]